MLRTAIQIPAQLGPQSGYIYVTAKLNGKRDATFLIDTGCRQSVLDKSLVHELEVPFFCLPVLTGSGDGWCTTKEGIIHELTIGKLKLHSLWVQIENLHPLSFTEGRRIDGIIGRDVLAKFAFTIDRRKNLVIFQDPDKANNCSGYEIKTDSGWPGVTAKFTGDTDVHFIVDTGCSSNRLPKTVVKKLSLPVMPSKTFGCYISGRPHEVDWVKVPAFKLNDVKIKDMWFTEDLSEGNVTNWGLLGNGFLNNYRLTLNLKNSQIFLEPYGIDEAERQAEQIKPLIDSGNYKKALSDLMRIIYKYPRDTKLRILKAETLFGLKQYEDCMRELNNCHTKALLDEYFYLMRARASEKLGNHKEAIQDMLTVSLIRPNDPYTHWLCGSGLIKFAVYEAAIDQFNKSLKIQPDLSQLYLCRAEAFLKLKDFLSAFADYDAAIKLSPDDPDNYSTRAWARNLTGKEYDKSIADCNKAISIDHNHASAYRNKGIAYFGKEDYAAALSNLNQSIKLDSFSERGGRTYYYRAMVYRKLGKYDLAQQDMKKSEQLEYDPKED